MPYRWGRYRWRRRYTYRRPRYFRRPYRRRFRAPVRRRYRRRKYLRRVRKKTLTLKQWNPPYMKNCKIKGQMQVIICGQGRQQFNYSQHKDEIVPAKMSGGGSFAVFVFNLGYLWQEHQKWRNIWTVSNENYDLCRYTGSTIKVFRPASVDLVLTITRHYPMLVNSGTYPATHPQRQLLQFKKYIIQSQQNKPRGKKYKKIKIKPPSLLNNRWFFQRDFINTNLFMISIASADLLRPYCSITGDNNCTGFNALNTNHFHNIAWQQAVTTYYIQQNKKVWGWADKKQWKELSPLKPYGWENVFYTDYLTGKAKVKIVDKDQSLASLPETTDTGTDITGDLLVYCRYNPTPDTGDNNIMYLKGMFTINSLEPSLNLQFSLQGLPLWLVSYGYFDWMVKLHSTYDIYNNYQVIIQSPHIATIPPITYKQAGNNELRYPAIIPVSAHFLTGRGLFDTDPLPLEQRFWYIKVTNQTSAVNNIVNTGPFIPKPNKEFSWCVQMNYTCYFKWGGTHHPSQEITNPGGKGTYPVPSQQLRGVQVKNPRKIQEIHPWHWRRDELTAKAIKRMLQDSETSTDSDSLTETPTKKKKTDQSDPKPHIGEDYNIQETFPSGITTSEESEEETSPETLKQQLHEQHLKQRVLQHYLFKSIKKLSQRQKTLSILTGPME
nr:MAG: ORF1 [Torque teno midi virus]